MNKKTAIITLTLLLSATPVLAIDSTQTANPRSTLQQRVDNRIQKVDTRIAQKETNIQQRRLAEASKAAMFRQKLEDKKLMIASHEAEVKAKIQAFRDKQKAEVATRVNTNLNKINQNQTEGMLKHLDLMSQLLDKLVDRINSNSPDIKDPSLANQAVADAREAIDKARTAVQAQAQKDYTISVTTEAQIRKDAQSKRDQLYKDIMGVRKLVIDAKQAVSNAVRVAKSGKIATTSANIKEGSSSGQQ